MEGVSDRLNRIRDIAGSLNEAVQAGKWDSARACAVTLQADASFIVDWLRGQTEYRFTPAPAATADAWEPTSEPPLGNVTEPLSGTLDADIIVA